jgi:hypothetical protein
MPRVADYSIVADGWVIAGVQDTRNFEVPSTIDAGSRSILGFMLDVENQDDMTITLRLNGTKVWTWSYSGASSHPVRFFQEVVAAGVVKPGTNVFSIDTSSGEKRFVQLSDIVVWWQANI